MTIKKHGGIFGRNPAFNEVDANKLNVDNLQLDGNTVRSTDTNGNIGLIPDGTGSLLIGSNNQASYVAAKIRKKFNGSVSVQFDGGGTAIYADLSMDANENLSLRLDPDSSLSDQTFSITHDGSAIAQFIGSSGDVKVNQGNLVIGTSGKGIDFSATAGTGTSELLDDYEEGTFSPTLTDGSTEASYLGRLGRYTKVGRLVHIELYFINLDTTGLTAGNSIVVGGLPFSHVTQQFTRAILNVQAHTFASTNGAVSAALDSAATTMTLIDGTSTQIKDALTVAALTSGTSDLRISGTYEAA